MNSTQENLQQKTEDCTNAHSVTVEPLVIRQIATTEIEKKYNELLYAVERKFPDETRHETALKYIRNAERKTDAGSAKSNLSV